MAKNRISSMMSTIISSTQNRITSGFWSTFCYNSCQSNGSTKTINIIDVLSWRECCEIDFLRESNIPVSQKGDKKIHDDIIKESLFHWNQ